MLFNRSYESTPVYVFILDFRPQMFSKRVFSLLNNISITIIHQTKTFTIVHKVAFLRVITPHILRANYKNNNTNNNNRTAFFVVFLKHVPYLKYLKYKLYAE